MFDLPPSLARAIEECVERFPAADVEREVGDLVSRYRASHEVTRHPLATPLAAAAYAAYRMPGTFAGVSAVFARVQAAIPGFAPRSMVDLGSGTGAAAWAGLSVWPELDTLTLIDQAHPALELGRQLAAQGPAPLAAARCQESDAAEGMPRADLAVAGYLLGELEPAGREALIAAMLEATTVSVFVEPGTPAGYRRILDVRSSLLSAGWTVAAPCPHGLRCPLRPDDWCHFAARFARSPRLRRLKRGEHDYEDEKYSYVVGTRLEITPALGRIIRHPQKRTGLVLLEVCEAGGTAATVPVSKRRGSLYRSARDARWGDPWP